MFDSLDNIPQYMVESIFKKTIKYIDKKKVIHGNTAIIFEPFKIRPKFIFREKHLFRIKKCDSRYEINGLILNTEDNKIQSVRIIQGWHPNMDPHTMKFCIDEDIQNKKFDFEYLKMIAQIIEIWRLTDCYEHPNPNLYSTIEMVNLGHVNSTNLNSKITMTTQ